jgi:L-amino acid N-acyltransferase YncA
VDTESFQIESWSVIETEGLDLIRKHYEEIAKYKDIALDPDHETYHAIENAKNLRVFTARDADKKLIGYAVFFMRKNMHYKSSLQAVQDIIYIEKSRRGFGQKLIKYCDDQLKAEGVQVVYHHVKTEHNFGPMLERQGYELIDLIYGRRLDEKDL